MVSIAKVIKNSGIDKKEATLLVSFILKKPKEFVIAHDDYLLDNEKLARVLRLFDRRKNHEPIAYLTGCKEFYGRDFEVDKNVLIPRPETETIIEAIKKLLNDDTKNVLDIGTGSGCIGITLKLERPRINVTMSEISKEALKAADINVRKFGVEVELVYSDLLKNIPKNTVYDIIVANLPYVDKVWETPPDLQYEPKMALYADDGGIDIIKKCIQAAPDYLAKNGYLVLELDPCQHKDVVEFSKGFGFKKHLIDDYILVLKNNLT